MCPPLLIRVDVRWRFLPLPNVPITVYRRNKVGFGYRSKDEMPIEISLPAAVPLSNAALDPPLLLQSLGCSPRE
uniref:Uncharacterized protein n=1 Tax=Picea glauca TaxID=3330 RepID=A0A101M2D1_PICGL|nr:hypothetical protein ABT39_MTgene2962 [Picea glauca]QHR89150.1 hypothetical protein Q903MT_gene3170 [Picea sitchensis]